MGTGQSRRDESISLLSCEAVACARGGRDLFAGLSFALRAGGAVHVTGPNGAGKSSLLRLLAGLLEPVAGRVARTASCALVDERAALDADRTVAQALRFWARIDASPAPMIDSALVRMGCAHLAAIPVRLLSTGQRKRVAIARTIASGAPIWLLDEPANGLDRDALPLLERAIADHRADGGGVVIASHITLALPYVEIVALAERGRS
ncbi:MAG: heme ABC exporter ATP-binding protein CcmA [Sphingomonadales bacterium]|nr:heme ABC exporter ATP-binding protein CcmA [Sphingomonadales bacterium]